MPLDLPAFLEPYRAALDATARPVARIVVGKRPPDVPWGSALGGPAYWPAATPWPVDGEGAPMHLLARIHFGEVPPMPGFPREGVLQVFLGGDDLYGLDFDAPEAQRGFRFVYHPATGGDDARLLDPPGGYPDRYTSPLVEPARARRLQFEPGTDWMWNGDVGFEDVVGDVCGDFVARVAEAEGVSEDAVWSALEAAMPGSGCKLGGHPAFTQEDPREPDHGFVLLLQLDSEDPSEALMWGDVGVANFFIRPDDLARADFSRVLYHWDCT